MGIGKRLTIRRFTAEDGAYRAEYALRNLVLRFPLGLDLTNEDLSRDFSDIHLGLWEEETLVAALLLHPLSDGAVQMRQVCVLPARQGNGFGTRLVRAAEELAKTEGFSRITLHGRETAAGFYRKLGYQTDGMRFYEKGIPHFAFEKQL